jgi:uncharacterized protein (DUF1501 family)
MRYNAAISGWRHGARHRRPVDALVTDLGDRIADVVMLTCSEFGRAVRRNGTVMPAYRGGTGAGGG